MFYLNSTSYILLYAIMPRFIISVRELYDHRDRRKGVDTAGFGASSQSAVSAIGFAGVETVERDLDGSEATRLGVLGDSARQV